LAVETTQTNCLLDGGKPVSSAVSKSSKTLICSFGGD